MCKCRTAHPRLWPVVLAYVALWAAVLLFSAVAAAVAVVIHTGGAVGNLDEAALRRLMLEATGSPAFMAASVIGIAVIDLVIGLGAPKLERLPLREALRLQPVSRAWRVYGAAAVGTLAVGQALTSALALLGIEPSAALRLMSDSIARAGLGAFAALLVGAGLLAPLGEEIFFRGYVQTRLTARLSPAAGIVLAAFGFGLLHLDAMHAPLAFALGLFLGWVVERTGSVRPAVVAHMANNLVFLLAARFAPAGEAEAPRAVQWLWLALSVGAVAGAIAALRRAGRRPHLKV